HQHGRRMARRQFQQDGKEQVAVALAAAHRAVQDQDLAALGQLQQREVVPDAAGIGRKVVLHIVVPEWVGSRHGRQNGLARRRATGLLTLEWYKPLNLQDALPSFEMAADAKS